MPATAAQPSGSDQESSLAPVVDLATRRGLTVVEGAAPDCTDTELQEQARQHWMRTFADAGLDLGTPGASDIVRLVANELERLVRGLLVIREGHGEALPANPEAGVDLTSAVEFTGVLHDLVRAVEAAQSEH